MNVVWSASDIAPQTTVLASLQTIIGPGLASFATSASERSFMHRFNVTMAEPGVAYPSQDGYNSANYLLGLYSNCILQMFNHLFFSGSAVA